ncbi:hypothetical protein N656DRAFT_123246 [Canariomyces notabilis]|uniref:Uncharacterized protein n=1 Tax=Canariomyces notabilis TaxID=2074819 RepID=A0AAN6YRN4_9PEZI|nr:hypothetical protein N656DRAFT_123246 [Canariomyces arenarius]
MVCCPGCSKTARGAFGKVVGHRNKGKPWGQAALRQWLVVRFTRAGVYPPRAPSQRGGGDQNAAEAPEPVVPRCGNIQISKPNVDRRGHYSRCFSEQTVHPFTQQDLGLSMRNTE